MAERTCATCGASLVWRRKRTAKAGGYFKCPADCPQRRGPKPKPGSVPRPRRKARPEQVSTPGTPQAPAPRPPRAPRPAKPTPTRRWLTDTKVRVCDAEGCMFDAGTCGHGRRPTKGQHAPQEQPEQE